MNTKVEKIIRALGEGEMQETALALLQRLESRTQARRTVQSEAEEAPTVAVQSAAVPNADAPAFERLQDELEAMSRANARAIAEAERSGGSVGAQSTPAGGAAGRYALFGAENTAEDGIFSAADAQFAPVSGGMDAISEFFRRDSRRYDTGFGGRNR